MEIKRYILVQWLTESRFGKTKFGIPIEKMSLMSAGIGCKFDRRKPKPPTGGGSFTLGCGGGSINSVKRSKIYSVKRSSFDRVYTSSSAPQCERNPPRGGVSYDQNLCGRKSADDLVRGHDVFSQSSGPGARPPRQRLHSFSLQSKTRLISSARRASCPSEPSPKTPTLTFVYAWADGGQFYRTRKQRCKPPCPKLSLC
jgi:hypothetical protein